MPRARTQSGNASCADTVSELATVIHATPATSIAGAATQTFGASATAAAAPACTIAPTRTSASRDNASRRRGRNSAAAMAPLPIAASSRVKVPASPPCSRFATSGSSASSAVDCRKNSATRSSAARMRGHWRTYCMPTRIAPTKRSPGSALAAFGSRRQRQMTTPATIDSTALSANTYALPALAISAPATIGPMMRDAFIAMPLSASAAGNCVPRHQLRHDGCEHRPAHRQPDAVGEGQRQQQRCDSSRPG